MEQPQPQAVSYGLRREVLSPMETLAQSVSTIAPTTTPAATIPLVCALAGNGTWFAYILATTAILLFALCVGKLARYSASPGSLYTYASRKTSITTVSRIPSRVHQSCPQDAARPIRSTVSTIAHSAWATSTRPSTARARFN